MPLFLDIHKNVEGISSEALAKAHQLDLKVQAKHNVNFINYWYNEDEGRIFCLCNAPSREAAAAVHREAHGGEADEIVEVKEGS